MKNELFVTAGEVAQELGVSKPFAYKLVRQMNEELEEKVLSQSPDVSAENIMKKNSTAWRRRRTKEGELWRHIKMNSVEHGMYRSIIMTGREELSESQERFQNQKRSYGVGTSFPYERSG